MGAMRFSGEREVEQLRKQYPEGTRVRLIHMADEVQAPPAGTLGTVTFVDDAGNVHVRWQNGSGLSLIPEADEFESVKGADG